MKTNLKSVWIKKIQSKYERNYKYHLCKEFGIERNKAQRLKDWTWNHIIKYLYWNTDKGKKIFSIGKIGNYDFEQIKTIYPVYFFPKIAMPVLYTEGFLQFPVLGKKDIVYMQEIPIDSEM